MRPAALVTSFLVLASFTRSQASPEQVEAIKQQGFEQSQVMRHLDHLVNRIGPRLTSSDNLTAACEWARDTFAGFGLEARLEEWGTFPVGFNRGPWWGRMHAPEKLEIACATHAWTAGTRGPSRGPVREAPWDAESLRELGEQGLKNAWFLDPPRGAFRATLDQAMVAAGGFGYLIGVGDLFQTGGSQRVDFARLPVLPSVQIHGDAYKAIKRHLQDGKLVEVEFDIRNHFRKGPIALHNVIADIRGTEFPDEYVVVGGHIDSWDAATGTTDNGTGTATTIEAARILAAIGARPRRSIRFMLWSGEEQGLLGSAAWVLQHKAEMPNYSACLVHDGGTNYLSGIAGMKEMLPQLETVFAPVIDLDPDLPFKIRTIRAFTPIGSDHESFTAVGVPGFFWDQAGKARYMRTHHTQYDTFDAAVPEYQKHSSVVVAIGALGLANLPEKLTRENMRVNRSFMMPPAGSQPAGSRRLGIDLDEDGVTITEVIDGEMAQKVGLQVGDKLLKIGERQIKAREDILPALNEGPASSTVTFQRGDKVQTVPVSYGK